MTIKVTITHDELVHANALLVTPYDADERPIGNVKFAPLYAVRVAPGESVSMYVHDNCRLRITEVPPLAGSNPLAPFPDVPV